LRQYREEVGLTQWDVCQRTNLQVNLGTIHLIENGFSSPTFETLELLGTVYRFRAMDLWMQYRLPHDPAVPAIETPRPLRNLRGESLAMAMDGMGVRRPGGEESRKVFELWDPETDTTRSIPYAEFVTMFQKRETLPIPASQKAYAMAVAHMDDAGLEAELQA